jgi:ethanolamine utilization protein EutN
MFLARIDGTLTSTVKHETLEGCRFLIGQRLDAGGGAIGDPLVLIDTLGAARGTTVMVTTDNETLRARVGKTTPARLVVVGLVDETAKHADDNEELAAPLLGRLSASAGLSVPPEEAPLKPRRSLKAAPHREPSHDGERVVSRSPLSRGPSTSKEAR